MLRVISLISVSNCIIKLCCIFVSYDWLQILKISTVFLFFKSRTVTLSDVSSSVSLNRSLFVLLLDSDNLYYCSAVLCIFFIMLFSTHRLYHSLPYHLSVTHQHNPLNVIYLPFFFLKNLLVNHLHIILIIGLFE